jgi:hypothetical protein
MGGVTGLCSMLGAMRSRRRVALLRSRVDWLAATIGGGSPEALLFDDRRASYVCQASGRRWPSAGRSRSPGELNALLAHELYPRPEMG